MPSVVDEKTIKRATIKEFFERYLNKKYRLIKVSDTAIKVFVSKGVYIQVTFYTDAVMIENVPSELYNFSHYSYCMKLHDKLKIIKDIKERYDLALIEGVHS